MRGDTIKIVLFVAYNLNLFTCTDFSTGAAFLENAQI